MAWEIGKQSERVRSFQNINKEILSKKGFLEEEEAKVLLYKFLRENITFAVDLIAGVRLFPFQHMAVKAMFNTDYTLGVWSRGMSKSYSTGIFAFLDAILNQGVEIGILAASFRQSKQIFRKIEDIAAKPEARLLAQCITKKSKNNDEWLMEIGESRIRALPLGDGSKLRGFRFHRIIIDEFLLMPERIYNEVILPFLSVVENPTEREDLYNIETKLIEKGEMEEGGRYKWPNNKLVALSSASYKFEYLYKLYQNFEDLIFNPNYAGSDGRSNATRNILQFSYDCAPKRLYDQNLIDQAVSSMSQSQFEREFGAKFTDDSSGYFKTSRMAMCTVSDGDSPSVEVKGDEDSKYIIAFDPSWAETENSDDFAIQVLKLNDDKKCGTLVHSYALAGTRMKEHIFYFHYLLTNFNVVAVIGDYNGAVQFLNAANESEIFKKANLKLRTLTADFNNVEKYQKELMAAKMEYDLDKKVICHLQKPSSAWIRRANELLQANFDHKKIWFGSRAVDDSYTQQTNKKIPIQKLKFLKTVVGEDRQNSKALMIDFVEHQSDMINLTKNECALIQITTSPQGTQTFDLPANLRRQSGPDKARKDSYSALVLGNWMVKIYYDMKEVKEESFDTFEPMFIK
jgi:hypothetical protein